ncbi:MAG: hypothetical protein WBZ16_11400 [Pseudolabrys sp.]
MISIYGDESSSAEFATYGLLAISDADLPALAIAVKRAKALLKSNGDEQLFIRKFSSTVDSEENLHLSTQALQTLKKRALSSLPKYRCSKLAFILVVLIGERHQKNCTCPLPTARTPPKCYLPRWNLNYLICSGMLMVLLRHAPARHCESLHTA